MCPDEELRIEAVPAFNYRFDYWSRDTLSTQSSEVYDTHRMTSVKAGNDKWLTAHFSQIVPNWLVALIIVAVVIPLLFLWHRKSRTLP